MGGRKSTGSHAVPSPIKWAPLLRTSDPAVFQRKGYSLPAGLIKHLCFCTMLPCNVLPVGVTLLLSLCEIFRGSRAFLDWPVSVRRRGSVERKRAPDFIQRQLLPSSSLGRVGACFKLRCMAGGGKVLEPQGPALSTSAPFLPLSCLPFRMAARFAQKRPLYATCPPG